MTRNLFSLLIALLFLQSCYYDVETELYPTNSCTLPDQVSFSTDILPIIEATCTTSCHTPGTSGEGSGVFIDNANTTAYEGIMVAVNSGTFESSVITQRTMPKGSALSSCHYDMINKWLVQGSPNN